MRSPSLLRAAIDWEIAVAFISKLAAAGTDTDLVNSK
jgi:hypothetical protein